MLTTSITTPLSIERGKTQTLSMPIFSSGTAITPTSGTITIFDSGNNKIVDAGLVVISNGIATYSLLSSVIPSTLSLDHNWLIEWTLVISGVTEIIRQQAALTLRTFYPVI